MLTDLFSLKKLKASRSEAKSAILEFKLFFGETAKSCRRRRAALFATANCFKKHDRHRILDRRKSELEVARSPRREK